MLIPVILSGGVGSRLWPLSREYYPKQFLNLANENSLLQNTLQRLEGLPALHSPLIVCNEHHRFLAAEQLRQLAIAHHPIILEPTGRNTAPAAAIAALYALKQDKNALLLLLPADHVIQDKALFQTAIQTGIPLAQAQQLVTFGIVPTRAETGYGYIKAAESYTDHDAFKIEEFVEKPDANTAQQYVKSGDYYWNSGMFLFSAVHYLAELQHYAPAIYQACTTALAQAETDQDFLRLNKESFLSCPSDSIDYAVMEHTQTGAVIPLDAGWSDVGAWSSLWEISEQDEQGNVLIGDTFQENTISCYVRAENRFVATLGLKDTIVVETADAVLVADKNQVQAVKNIVNQLKQQQRDEADLHQKVHRPWGSYDTICINERFKVKHIIVNVGESLSLQCHYHRSEHWVVVKGTAQITRNDEVFLLTENQSTYIPLGSKHRLENVGRFPLEMIEIQSGSYLAEDDIVRFDDVYGRD